MRHDPLRRRPVALLLALAVGLAGLGLTSSPALGSASGGHITGQVTRSDGTPIQSVRIEVAALPSGSWSLVGNTWTDADGHYEYDTTGIGPHLLRFSGYDYVPEWWDDAPTVATATTVQVTPGSTSVANAVLAAAGSIKGTVTGTGGVEVPDVEVSAWKLVGSEWVSTTMATHTVQHGKYSLSELPVGAYRLRFEPPSGSGYSTEWWDDARTVETATTVQVAAGPIASVKNAQLDTATPATPTVVNTDLPTISGTTQVGVPVTATAGAWTPSGTSPAYQWLVAGSPVTGAIAASYTPVAADVGKSVQVRVAASASGFTTATATSPASTVGVGVLNATTKPKVTGKAKKNATLKVSPGTWSPKTKVTYHWYAGAKAIPKATAAKLKLAGKTLKTVKGKAISVLLTITAPGYNTVTTKLKVPGKVKLR